MKKAAFFALLATGSVFAVACWIVDWVLSGDSFTAAEEEASREPHFPTYWCTPSGTIWFPPRSAP